MPGNNISRTMTDAAKIFLNWRVPLLVSVTAFFTCVVFFFIGVMGGAKGEVFATPYLINAGFVLFASSVYTFFTYIAFRLGLVKNADEREIFYDQWNKLHLKEKIDEILSAEIKSAYFDKTDVEIKTLIHDYMENQSIEIFQKKIIDEYEKIGSSDWKISQCKTMFEHSQIGLSQQLESQRFNSNLNLLMGLLFSFVGVAALGYLLYNSYSKPVDDENILHFILNFIPRITFVILVESFAFFFLTLYKEDRSMIRYFRNEITNFESKFIALETSARLGNEKDLSEAIKTFLSTERNITMKKGERLIVDVQKEDSERLFDKFIDKLSNNFDLTKFRKSS